jgi:hypothetical protein
MEYHYPALFETDAAMKHNGSKYHDQGIIRCHRGSLDIVVTVL